MRTNENVKSEVAELANHVIYRVYSDSFEELEEVPKNKILTIYSLIHRIVTVWDKNKLIPGIREFKWTEGLISIDDLGPIMNGSVLYINDNGIPILVIVKMEKAKEIYEGLRGFYNNEKMRNLLNIIQGS